MCKLKYKSNIELVVVFLKVPSRTQKTLVPSLNFESVRNKKKIPLPIP